MRVALPLLLSAVFLAACASPQPAPPAAAPAEAPKAQTAKAPQCWSGDESRFIAVGQKARVAGVDVVCTATSDGKNAQWMGAQHK